jgi:tRNA(fMet)-specific endonuclease VapC
MTSCSKACPTIRPCSQTTKFPSTDDVLLDANIVIFALNKRKPWIAARLETELAARTALIVPSIFLFEFDYGIAKSKRAVEGRLLLEAFFANGFAFPDFDVGRRA